MQLSFWNAKRVGLSVWNILKTYKRKWLGEIAEAEWCLIYRGWWNRELLSAPTSIFKAFILMQVISQIWTKQHFI